MQITPAGNNRLPKSVSDLRASATSHASTTPDNPQGAAGEVYYSPMGFPDSTKSNAVINPPDRGTSSSLEWTPSLDFEFPDFQTTQFLKPTLKVSGAPERRSPRSYAPVDVAPRSGQKTQSQQPTLHKSIDQQVGLLGAH